MLPTYAGNRVAVNIAIIEITVSNSVRVKSVLLASFGAMAFMRFSLALQSYM
jgi:hypothetical protein